MNICFATNHLYIPMLRNIYKKEREDEYIPFQLCSFNQKSKYRFLKKCQETSQPSENQGENLHNSKLKFAYSLFKQTSLAFDADFQYCISFSQPLPFCQFVILMLHYLVQRKKFSSFPTQGELLKNALEKRPTSILCSLPLGHPRPTRNLILQTCIPTRRMISVEYYPMQFSAFNLQPMSAKALEGQKLLGCSSFLD